MPDEWWWGDAIKQEHRDALQRRITECIEITMDQA